MFIRTLKSLLNTTIVFVVILLFSALHSSAQSGALDPGFSPGLYTNGSVHTSLIQEDGKVIICGYFTTVTGVTHPNIARLNIDGTLDASFGTGAVVSDGVVSIAQQLDGKFIIGGNFTTINGISRSRVARLNADGTLDVSFNPGTGANDYVSDICVQPDGKIIIGGAFTTINSTSHNKITRLNNDGTIDNTFNVGTGASASISGISLQSDGKIIIGGDFISINGVSKSHVARLNADGTLDTSFEVGTLTFTPGGGIYTTSIQNDGQIIIGGGFTSLNGNSRNKIARLNTDGSIDFTFNAGTVSGSGVSTNVIQPDGKIVIGGFFTSINGVNRTRIARLNTDGTLDLTFDPGTGADSDIYTVSMQQDGKLIIGGAFSQYNGSSRNKITRLFSCFTTSNTITETHCESFTINGETFNASGNYTQILTNFLGCDSILTLNLTILNSSVGTDIQNACDYYTWIDGVTYTLSTNTPTFTLQNINGCDSLVTLNLTINNSTSGTDLQIACNSYTWIDGITYITSTNTPTFTFTNSNGCDSIVTLNLTIQQNTGIDTQISCDSLTWIDGITYYSSTNTPTWTLTNLAGCDSIVTLHLTVFNQPTIIENTFSIPSDLNNCVGEIAVNITGNSDFELNIDGLQTATSSGYHLFTDLCPGIHDLQIINFCNDTTTTQFVIPIDSNYVFNNSFIDSLAQDSLGMTLENCDIYYAGIDTAYIDSIWATGNTVNVIWNIVDSNGSNLDTTTYVLNNGNGVYWLQLSVFCPVKALGDYFTVTEAIYFENGHVSSAGIAENDSDNFMLYPNPTNDLVTISFDGNNANYTIYDAQGKLIQTSGIISGGTVSLKDMQTGVYFLVLKTENGSAVKRVVKN